MKMQGTARPPNKAARIEPLEVLPVFLKLDGKRVIVVGGSVGALWKTELLLQAGANVTLVCDRPDSSVFELLSRDWSGRLELCTEHWRSIPFDGFAVVIGDVPEEDAQPFYSKGRLASAIVNVVDKSEYCDVQFGSIVNQSPVVIGISTGGAAPVLAQIVRGIIETALPERLQALSRKAKFIRRKVNARLGTSQARRAYWGAFFGRLQIASTSIKAAPYDITKSDVQDLTVRDLAMLRSADDVYLFPGASEKIAQLARREARWHMVSDPVSPGQICGASVLLRPALTWQHRATKSDLHASPVTYDVSGLRT